MPSDLNYQKMAPNLYRRKRGNLPKSLKEFKDKFSKAQILEKCGKTRDRKDHLYLDTIISKKHSFCVFASPKTFQALKQNRIPCPRRYLLDGTFKVSPRQLYRLCDKLSQFYIVQNSIDQLSELCIFSRIGSSIRCDDLEEPVIP